LSDSKIKVFIDGRVFFTKSRDVGVFLFSLVLPGTIPEFKDDGEF